jgi:RNA polymerase sigma-70 factor (ECF subfamily)
VSAHQAANGTGTELLALYDLALPQVYGYLLARCGARALAEDLTAETFLAAVDAVRRGADASVNTPWLIGVARHKMVDHWRRAARESRSLRAVAEISGSDDAVAGPEQAHLDAALARSTLDRLAPHHRVALTLRYLDDLPVPEVARLLDRTLHATEALLVRARAAFRRAYTELAEGGGGD